MAVRLATPTWQRVPWLALVVSTSVSCGSGRRGPKNEPPEWAAPLARIAVSSEGGNTYAAIMQKGQAASFTLSAIDPEHESLSLEAASEPLPAGVLQLTPSFPYTQEGRNPQRLTFAAQSIGEGSVTLTFVARDPAGASATLTLRLQVQLPPPVVSNVEAVSGNAQRGIVGHSLAEPVVVRVTDQYGDPLSGALVTFSNDAVGANMDPQVATSDALGLATSFAHLGVVAGQQEVRASVAPLAKLVRFSAAAFADVPATITALSGDAQTGTVGAYLALPLRVAVHDAFGNPASRAPISFRSISAGGAFDNAEPLTDDTGVAQAYWTLGPNVGVQVAEASTLGLSETLTFVADATVGLPSAVLYSSGDGQIAPPASSLPEPLVVTVVDRFANPVPGAEVTFAVVAGAATLDPSPVQMTDAAGHAAVGLVLGPVAEVDEVRADTVGVAQGYTFTVTGADVGVAHSLTYQSGDAQSGAVGAAALDPLAVRVLDAFGAPVAGVDVAFSVVSGDASLGSSSFVTSGADGLAAAQLTYGQSAGAIVVRAEAVGLLGSPVDFALTALPGPPASISYVSGDGQVGPANTALPERLVVEVADAFGNSVAGVAVAFAVTSGDGALIDPALQQTDSAGLAQNAVLLGTTVGATKVEATSTVLVGQAVTFTLTTIGAGPEIRYVSGSGQQAPILSALSEPFTVLVVDAAGAPLAGVDVTFAPESSGVQVLETQPRRTDANGYASSTARFDTRAGPQAVSATLLGARGSPVTFDLAALPGAPATLTAKGGDGQACSISSALPLPIVVEVSDAYGNRVPDVLVGFAITAGGGSLAAAQLATDATGKATNTWTLGPTVGDQSVEVAAPVATGSPLVFSARANPMATALLMQSGDGQSAVAGEWLADPLVVAVVDNMGAPVPFFEVSFKVTSGGGVLADPSPQLTDASGLAAASLRLGAGVGPSTVEVTAPCLAGSPLVFSANALSGLPTGMQVVSGDAQRGAVGSALPAPVVVRVHDANNNPVQGVAVTFATSDGRIAEAQPQLTDVRGEARASWIMPAAPGAAVASVAASGLASLGVSAIAQPLPFTLTKESGDGQTGAVITVASAPLVVRITDGSGAAVPGYPITFASQLGGGSPADPQPRYADANGVASSIYRFGRSPGPNTVAASAPAVDAPAIFNLTAVPGPAYRLTKVSGDAQTGLVNTPLAEPFVVRVTDVCNNSVVGSPVTFTLEAGAGSLSGPQPIFTDGNGLASSTLTFGALVGEHWVYATAPGLVGSPAGFVADATGTPASIAMVSGDGQSAVVNTALPQHLDVVVRDYFGNPVPNVDVTFAVTEGSAYFRNGTIITTDSSGVASARTVMGTVAGPVTITASVDNLTGSPVVFSATALPGTARRMWYVSGGNQKGMVGNALPAPFVVAVRDGYGNGVAGIPVDFSVVAGGGLLVTPSPILSDTDGYARATLVLGTTLGVNSVVASNATLLGSPIAFDAQAQAGPPASITIVSGDGQVGTVGTQLAELLTVRVEDSFGNPVAFQAIIFSVVQGAAALSPAVVATDSKGQGATMVTLGATAGATLVQASVTGAGSVVFTLGAQLAPASISSTSGDNQSAVADEVLAQPLCVRVLDVNAAPLLRVPVSFAPDRGGTAIDAQPRFTDIDGYACSSVRAAPLAGVNTIVAQVVGSPALASTFIANVIATAGVPTRVLELAGNNQLARPGKPLPQPLRVRVTDGFDAPVANVAVTFSAGSAGLQVVDAQPCVTDALGEAESSVIAGRWRGQQHAVASAGSLAGSPVRFTVRVPTFDFNGDGFDDVIVGAPQYNGTGAAYVFFGGSAAAQIRAADSADLVLEGETTNGLFGATATSAGDFNGDGYDDALVTAELANGAAGNATGAVFIFFGSASLTTSLRLASSADVVIVGDVPYEHLGSHAARAGDFNADGFEDVVIGVSGDSGAAATAGSARIFYGGDRGPLPWQLLAAQADVTLLGVAAGDRLGTRVAGLGDFDGDGYDDIAVAAPFSGANGSGAGAVYVVFGQASPTAVQSADSAPLVILGERAYDNLGTSLGAGGDVDGDGFNDLLLGAPVADGSGTDSGKAYLVVGGSSTLANPIQIASEAAVRIAGATAGERFGSAISGLGDVNADGFADIIIGAREGSSGGLRSGSAYILLGGAALPRDVYGGAQMSSVLVGEDALDRLGSATAAVGDFDGDGQADFIVGAPNAAVVSSTVTGAAYLFLGTGSLASSFDASSAALIFTGISDGDQLGACVGN